MNLFMGNSRSSKVQMGIFLFGIKTRTSIMQSTFLLNAVIVDDEPMAIKALKHHLDSIDFLKVTEIFSNAITASKYLESNKIDLLFLDINMPKLNGLRMLESLSNKPMIIFTTAHPHHAYEAFEYDAIDFLLK